MKVPPVEPGAITCSGTGDGRGVDQTAIATITGTIGAESPLRSPRPSAPRRPARTMNHEKELRKMSRLVEVTELVLRDGHQSLLATRMATEDMVGACEDIDQAGFWSVECWGGATYDSCIRFLNEDPWERLRTFRKLMPNSRLQMLLRGQNLLGYRHYEDTVVDRFVDKSAENGMDVFRVFDALNDVRNLQPRAGRRPPHRQARRGDHLLHHLAPAHRREVRRDGPAAQGHGLATRSASRTWRPCCGPSRPSTSSGASRRSAARTRWSTCTCIPPRASRWSA